jgi:hypothetical protein
VSTVQKEFTVTVLKIDLTHYIIGAVSLDACKYHAHKEEKYPFFADSYIFHSLLYLNMCDQMN